MSADAFAAGEANVPPTMCAAPGTLLNANTLDDFKEWDKNALLERTAATIWDDMRSGACWEQPELLGRFLLISFADLKTHRFYYWRAPKSEPHAPSAAAGG